MLWNTTNKSLGSCVPWIYTSYFTNTKFHPHSSFSVELWQPQAKFCCQLSPCKSGAIACPRSHNSRLQLCKWAQNVAWNVVNLTFSLLPWKGKTQELVFTSSKLLEKLPCINIMISVIDIAVLKWSLNCPASRSTRRVQDAECCIYELPEATLAFNRWCAFWPPTTAHQDLQLILG